MSDEKFKSFNSDLDSMKIFLFLLSILAFISGFGILTAAKSAIHEIEGFVLYIVSAILFSGSAIIGAINHFAEKTKKSLNDVKNLIEEEQKKQSQQNISIVDEIRNLGQLLQSGFLTLEEFQQQKAKLLGTNDIPKKLCPKCSVPMKIAKAKNGEHQGKQFYVCSNYPECREYCEV